MTVKKIKKQTALDLEIKGSMGTFSVGDAASQSSIRVHYLQTHVNLSVGGDHQEKLIKALSPVREVFPTKRLDFEQIMQRDIDDARVSTDLIPYLLEERQTGLVKLFPPIIVAVLPTNADGLPADYYPTVTESDEHDADSDITWHLVRSGEIGAEVFELRQVKQDEDLWDHDYATLKINTSRSALVIVDGQHRAMALIALYRNIKGWPDNAKGVEPYYRLWPASLIKKFDLSGVKLPVMLCVFPQLTGSSADQLKAHAACRSIFLALNKNARKVTKARTWLLDDRDVVSAFMRAVLTRIKESSDTAAESSVRLWNVELDADEDRVVLTSPTAYTGVMHLFGLIERLMLGTMPGNSLSGTRQNVSMRNRLDQCFRRLQVTDALPKTVVQDSRRDNCDPDTRRLVVKAFESHFGDLIVRGFSDFAPYSANNAACLYINSKLSVGAVAEFYRGILLEGQGMDRVFSEFSKRLSEREFRDQNLLASSPEVTAVQKEFKDRQDNLKKEALDLVRIRLDRWLGKAPTKLRESKAVRDGLEAAYDGTFTTAAFQNALFITFFAVVIEVNERRSKPPTPSEPLTIEEVRETFSRYLEDVNEFFRPSSEERITRLLQAFVGRVTKDGDDLQVGPWDFTLRAILIPGELKPDEWTRFRLIFAELWRPVHKDLKKTVDEVRKHLRKQALDQFTLNRQRERSTALGVPLVKLPSEEREKITKESADIFLEALKTLGSNVKLEELLKYQSTPEETPPTGANGSG